VLRRRELRVAVVALILLTAGCGATAEPTDEPQRNATLSLSGYDPAANASPVTERAFWDRSSTWEDPRVRNVTVTSRTHTYRNLSGADAVVVYTTPKKPYVQADRPRSMTPGELAALATRSVDTPRLGTDSRPAGSASLLDQNVTVQALSDAGAPTTGHVAHITTSDAVVIVVVVGDADDRTIERVLDGVTLYGGFGTDG
jgi:hypothetical protein